MTPTAPGKGCVLDGERNQQKNSLDIWAPLAKPFMFLERLRSPSLIETILQGLYETNGKASPCHVKKHHDHGCPNTWSHTETALSISLYNHVLNSPMRGAEDNELLSNREGQNFNNLRLRTVHYSKRNGNRFSWHEFPSKNDTLHESKFHLRLLQK